MDDLIEQKNALQKKIQLKESNSIKRKQFNQKNAIQLKERNLIKRKKLN